MINLPPAEIDDAAFANCCESLPPDVKERIAGAFPSYFTAAFVFPGSGADVRPASPGPAKAREPKATPTVDKEALRALFDRVKARGGEWSAEDVAEMDRLYPTEKQ